MWDEEKFFKDFKEEAKQVEPDPEFVDKLLSLTEQEEKKVIDFRKSYKFVAVACAAVLLCAVGIRVLPINVTDEVEFDETELHANNASSEQDSDVISGTIGAFADPSLKELQELLSSQDCEILEAGERVLTEEEVCALAASVSTAKLISEQDNLGEGTWYHIKQDGETIIEFTIVDNCYLLLDNGEKVYEMK